MNASLPPSSAGRPLSQDEIEERAIDEYARRNPVDYAAAAWHLRRARGFGGAEEEREFAAWLAADPAHEAAFRATERAFDELRGFSPRRTARLKATIDALALAPPSGRRTDPRAFFGKTSRFFLFPRLAAVAGAVLLLVAVGWLSREVRSRPLFAQHYASARGQQLSASLPDGSVLFIDALSRADVLFYRDRREVRLPQGQIFFTVAPDAARPFHVLAGGARVRVTGTRFSVRHFPDDAAADVRVRVAEGRVEVSGETADGRPTRPVELAAGQGLLVGGAGALVPLAEALAEFERYGPTGLVVRDPAVARLRVGGSFQLRRLDLFLHALPRLLPVRLERRGGVTEIVRADGGSEDR
jgi:transmembrane sensor